MTTIKAIRFACSRSALAFALSLATAAPVAAADWPAAPVVPVAPANWSYKVVEPPASFVGEFGLRFWYGRGTTAKDLFDVGGGAMISRLTYSDFDIFAAEGYSRFDFNSGWFLKGYVGGALLSNGKLKDEDFEPFIVPYSATLSRQQDGSAFYGSVDAGFKLVRGPDFHIGAFGGYHFLAETVQGFGCGQVATNPLVCGGGIPDTIAVISQVNRWNSLRVGLEASVDFNSRFRFTVDAAYLPIVWLDGADSHYLRIGPLPGDFTGPIPEDGKGWGYQLEAALNYRLTDIMNVGIGGRYWHMEAKGSTHFEGHIVGFMAAPQPVNWRVDHFGVFFQTSVKLGPYPLISSN